MFEPGLGQLIGAVVLFFIAIVAFMRMGAGRWYRSPVAGLARAFSLWLAIQLVGAIGYLPLFAIGLLAGRFA